MENKLEACERREHSRQKVKLVSFDLDDTLIREIHSVLLPCILNVRDRATYSVNTQNLADILPLIIVDDHS